MRNKILSAVAVVALAGGVAACGGGDTTTVIQPGGTSGEQGVAPTPPAPSTDWSSEGQELFLDGCGHTDVCQCVLEHIMPQIPENEVYTSPDPVQQFKQEIVEAAVVCA